jgi:Tfp pilus assembly protein PilX
MTRRTRQDFRDGRNDHERGSALVIALLIMVIMTLLGLAFILVGETEARIARNQRDMSQAQFVAEGGARMVKNWFERPDSTSAISCRRPRR